VPQGTSITYAAAHPVFGDNDFPVLGYAAIGFSGVFQLSYGNEGAVANVLGVVRPAQSWGAKLQILPRREQYPAIALFIRSTIGWQLQYFGANDIENKIPELIIRGFNGTLYECANTSAGIAAESQLNDVLALRFTLGVQELQSRNFWLFIAPAPAIGNGYHSVEVQSSYILDGSANASISIKPQLALIAEIDALPYYGINLPENRLEPFRAYAGMVGVRYALSRSVNLDTYIRQQSKINSIAQTQFRLGLSGQLTIAQ
jgi:hypothetical protein